MALTAKPTLAVTIEYIDGSGSPGRSTGHLPATLTLAEAITKTDALCAAIQAASDCGVVSYSISTGKVETGTPSANSMSRVEHKAAFTFRTAAGKSAQFSFPEPNASLVHPSGGLITTDPLMAAVVTALAGDFCDSNGSLLTVLIADEEISERTSVKQRTSDTSPAT
jgi:hypothetical protein